MSKLLKNQPNQPPPKPVICNMMFHDRLALAIQHHLDSLLFWLILAIVAVTFASGGWALIF